ncbi:MAG: DUF3189 family protein [Syntrophomonadaceae bacterium]|nr:DUF3189 family protein [Syntrophomonadaceae bacterium]
MKIIFIGTTGVHQALLAANIYLERVSTYQDIDSIDDYFDVSKDTAGFPIFIGQDSCGNRIYTIGAGGDVLIAKKAIEDLVRILGFSNRDMIVKPVNTPGSLAILAAVRLLGGKASQSLSRFIIKLEFSRIKEDIQLFKSQLRSMDMLHFLPPESSSI